MAEKFTKSFFQEYLNTKFELQHPERPVELALVEVEGLSADAANEESFSLVFVAPGREHFPQAIYPMHHEKLEPFDLFLVPFRADGSGVYYQAVFNRMSMVSPSKK